MPQDLIANLEALLAGGKDGASLRFALASRYFAAGDAAAAARHAEAAVGFDSDYSAAWKLLGRARAAAGMRAEADAALQRGIEVAERCGDRQAAKEMQVFRKRLQRQAASSPPLKSDDD